ncbi:MAG: DNA-3-methyladenine glycosylase 2 family protein [Gammaproteobacteria bacterium]
MADRLDEAGFAREVSRLARCAPEFRTVVRRHGVPAFWRRSEGIETLVRIILEQQVSLSAAATLYRRIRRELGGITAGRLVAAGPERLHDLGMTRQKARYCHALGEAVKSGQLSFPALRRSSDEEAIARLTALPGIGPWTAGAYVMAAMRRRDVWPPGDLALERAIARLLPEADPAELARTGERWRPRRAVAARLLWHYYRAEVVPSGRTVP